ncbi:MAG: FG-GAP repeat protein [Candidatus Eisenbacteria sp.]|nr:FG-GAP repeat protein [Candidatus Eisenbacteria bacterium]
MADPMYSEDFDEEGIVYVYFGGPGADDESDLQLYAPEPEGMFGTSVAAGKDINSDGWADIMASCP